MKKVILFTLISFLAINVFAQMPFNKLPKYLKANSNWVMYDSIGINFNSSSPEIFTTALSAEGSSTTSVSDPNTGQLLFYISQGKIWNRNHQIMTNGNSLLGNNLPSYSPPLGLIRQCIRIAPVINEESKYYVFSMIPNFGLHHADDTLTYNITDSFAVFYSIVDMSLNEGLGDVVPNFKNIPVTPVARKYGEAMLIVPGNCNDYWLVLHRNDSSIFESYHIDNKGISNLAVVSNTNTPFNQVGIGIGAAFGPILAMQGIIGYLPYLKGSLCISPDRTKLIYSTTLGLGLTTPQSTLAEFDANTGLISNEKGLVINPGSPPDSAIYHMFYASAISPDNSKLYTIEADSFNHKVLYQYDITQFNIDSINHSKQFISYINDYDAKWENMRLYKDTIYISDGISNFIGIIAQPNEKGRHCGFNARHIILPENMSNIANLPVDVVLPYEKDDTISNIALDTIICKDWGTMKINLQPLYDNGSSIYEWNTGATSASIQINNAGIYWVRYTDGCVKVVDTFKISDNIIVPPVVTHSNGILSTSSSYTTYQWLFNSSIIIPGATYSSYQIHEYGDYQVIVTNESGCTDTSNVYTHFSNGLGIGNSSMAEENIKIFPNPASNTINIHAKESLNVLLYNIHGRLLKNFGNTSKVNIDSYSDGVYILLLLDKSGNVSKREKLIKKSR